MGKFFSINLQDTLTVLFFPLNDNYLKVDSVKENSNLFFNINFWGFFIFSFSQGLFFHFLIELTHK